MPIPPKEILPDLPAAKALTTRGISGLFLSMKGTFNVCAFFVGLAVSAVVLGKWTAPLNVPAISDKLAWWSAHSAEYDTLIIGTSRLYHGVIPSVLDRAVASEGTVLHSFNLGLDGMRPPEDDFVLEKALAAPGLKLRWVIVECNGVKMELTDSQHEGPRDIYWHDWRRLGIIWRSVWATVYDDQHSFSSRASRRIGNLGQFVGHVRLWLWRELHVGAGLVAFAERGHQELLQQPVTGSHVDGYGEQRTLKPIHGTELNDYLKTREKLVAKAPELEFGDTESQSDLRRKRDLIESVGAKMFLVRPPYLNQEVFCPDRSLRRVSFFDCSDPSRFPKLYSVAMRRDFGHTNEIGSTLFSEMLAHELTRIEKRDARRRWRGK
jgi:hypothetical protein